MRADSDAAADDVDKNYLNGIHVRFVIVPLRA